MPSGIPTNRDSFTPKQIQIFRKLLRDFKLGNRLSWLQVAREIIASESNEFDFPKKEGGKKKDKGWSITERILRNFVDGEDYRGKGKKEKTKIRSNKKLGAIRDFLIEEGLLPSMFDEEGFLKFREAYYLSQYFSKGNNEGFIWEEIDLSGIYKINEIVPSEDRPRTLKVDLFENERFYEIEERYFFQTHGGLKDIKHWGWAVNMPFEGLLIFLQRKDGNTINHHMYKDIKNAGLYKPEGVFLGRDMKGHPIFFDGETHGLTLAPAGSGKTVSFVIPQLCHQSISTVTTDLKGTNSVMVKNLKEKHHKQKAYFVNPANLYSDLLGIPACYNPIIILIDDWKTSTGQKDLIADAQAIALQLLPEPKVQGENSFFRNGSRKLVVFCLIFIVTQKSEDKVTLSQVLKLLRNVPELMEAFYIGSCTDILNGELADMSNDLLKKFESQDQRQVESFREGALQGLEAFSPSGWLAESTSKCDFRFKDLKETPTFVSLIADPTKMKVFAPWLGLIIWAAITELTRCQNNRPVFFLLEECTNFYVHGLSNSLTALREFGIRVWFIIQELQEYSRIYGREALDTLLSQTEVKQIFGTQSQKTAELVSQMLGEETIKSPNYSLGHDINDPIQKSINEGSRRLLTPDEVRRFPDTIIFIRDQFPIRAIKTGYHEVKPWSKWVGINPLFGKKLKGKTKVWLRY